MNKSFTVTIQRPVLSVVIAVYKNISALNLILQSLDYQSFTEFEVIVAEDNDDPKMVDFLERANSHFWFPIHHISQPDNGFQKDKALNKAVAVATTDYMVFIDGDCVLHRHFLKQHFLNKEEGVALYGRRVMLSQKLTERLNTEGVGTLQFFKKSKHLESYFSLFSLCINRCKRIDCAFYLPFLPSKIHTKPSIWGCNWSIHKKHLIAVNGFDEDYIKPGCGEDTDIEWRLLKTGIRLKKIKFKAIQYHLWHAENYADTVENEGLMWLKKAEGYIFCEKGINQYL
jgi:cellulose synthase/poly-beta-1,6-N-acetylglucosamine synthase-like glycosyltransferase